MSETADVGNFNGEVGVELATEGHIERVGIRSFEFVVDSPSNHAQTHRVGLGKAVLGSGAQDGLTRIVGAGNNVEAGEARSDDRGFIVGGIVQLRVKAEGAVLIEGVDETFADAVVDNAEASANAALSLTTEESVEQAVETIGRPGKGNARTEVLVVPIVVAGLAVGLAGPVVSDKRLGADATIIELSAKAGSGGDLKPVRLPGRREE